MKIFPILLFIFSLNIWAQSPDPLVATGEVVSSQIMPGQTGTIKINLQLPEEYHAYADQFNLLITSPEGFVISKPKISPIKNFLDKFTGHKRLVMEKNAQMVAAFEAPMVLIQNSSSLKLELTYQACTEKVCLFPTKKSLEIPVKYVGFTIENKAPIEKMSNFFSMKTFNDFLNMGLLASLIFVFLAGVFTSFTPCIFPMIPITLAILGKDSEKHSRLQNFLLSIVYVHGIATTYSVLGIIAAKSGNVFGASLGSPLVLSLVCVVFMLMALSMFGLFEIQMPNFVRHHLGRGSSQKGYVGAYLSGLFAGVVASPCVGPVLVAILAYVSTQHSVFLGFILLFTYAIGLGLIFIILGLSNQLTKLLPKSGPWMNLFKFVLGSLMLVAFYYYLDMLVPTRIFDFILGSGLIIVSSYYGAFMNPNDSLISAQMRPYMYIKKGKMLAILYVGIVFILLSVFNLRPILNSRTGIAGTVNKIEESLIWENYSNDFLAKSLGKPIILDFYADWCASCHELQDKTFSDPAVMSELQKYSRVKFNATETSSELKELNKKYGIQGLPTILFFNTKGEWLKDRTLTQFEEPQQFLERLKANAQ